MVWHIEGISFARALVAPIFIIVALGAPLPNKGMWLCHEKSYPNMTFQK